MPKFCIFRPNTSKLVFTLTLFLISLLYGCRFSTTAEPEKKLEINTQHSASRVSSIPEANIFIDDIMLSKPYAVIGGTVQNIGGERLEKLSVDIELRRREDNSLIQREVNIVPDDLAPGEMGKFSLKVLSNEWSGSRILSLRSGTRKDEVAFKSLPGAKRPPEKLSPGKTTNVPLPRKSARPEGEEFLNTPDTPIKVP